jgi:predicted RNase H-like HicB family nuclease
MVHKRITIELIGDSKDRGYTVVCDEFPEAIAQGDDINDALINFMEAVEIIKQVKEEDKNGETIGDLR